MSVIGIGETVYDIIFRNDSPTAAIPGGSTFNAMISIGRTVGKIFPDITVKMITETGSDHIGDIIVDFMESNGVSSEYVTRNKGTQSHISLAFLDDNNDAQYEFYKDHEHAVLSENIIDTIKFKENDIVVFGSYFAINPKIRQYTLSLLKAAHSAGAILYYDINFRKNHLRDLEDTLPNIIENCRLADFVRGSAEDFNYLFGTGDPEEIYKKHIADYCSNFICTCGADPVHVFAPGFHRCFDAPQVETVSTVGAGDNFNAGFVFGLLKEDLSNTSCRSMSPANWEKTVFSAGMFASEACTRLENYVDTDFWVRLR